MTGRILIIDDAELSREVLDKVLRDEYELEFAENGEEGLAKLDWFSPDIVLLDIMMPGLDGYEVCRRIKASPVGDFTQIIIVSAKTSTEERLLGFKAGADGYVAKPFDADELLATIQVHLRLRHAQEQLWQANNQLQQFNTQLEEVIRRRSAEVVATRDITIFALAKLAESRDPETGEHLDRIRRYSRLLAELLAEDSAYSDRIDDAFIKGIYQASPLHDIGKVGIPDAILLKPGRLTFEEFEIMKQHVVIGYETLCEAAAQGPSGGFLDMAAEVARHHHEKFDGTGYPDGLAGEEIPLSARIVAVADVFDALTSARVYKPAFDPGVAKALIEKESGGHFDPEIVKAFRRGYDQFLEIWSKSPRRKTVAADQFLATV